MKNAGVLLLILLVISLVVYFGDKGDPNSGPGEWLTKKFPSLQDGEGIEIGNQTHYERLVNPTITTHIVDDLSIICKSTTALGCAIGTSEKCDIYLGIDAKDSTIAHELRHCYGWSHASKRINGHYQWYPNKKKLTDASVVILN